MDVHPSRELVASGQRGGRDRKSQAHVRIWSTESLQTLYVFGMGELDSGVTSVAFSQLVCFVAWIDFVRKVNYFNFKFKSSQNGGSYILAVDAGRESILSVWQWQWGHLLGKVAVRNLFSIFFCFFSLEKENGSHVIPSHLIESTHMYYTTHT